MTAVVETILTLAEQPALEQEMRRLHRSAWPPFLRDDEVNAVWSTLYSDFAEFQLAILDGGRVVAIGNAIPFQWDGTRGDLPDRIVDVLANGIRTRERGGRANTLSALAAIVDHDARNRGFSRTVIAAMRDLARRHDLRALVAPVRPSLKGRYPLVSMERYAQWRSPDGGPFDPWLRVHWRLGARVLRITPRGNTVRATVREWEEWTGVAFPESGRYIVPDAFRPVLVDRERDRVRYEEANVWMLHRVAGSRSDERHARR